MLNKLLGAAAMAAVALVVVPASCRKDGCVGCSGDNQMKTETMIDTMADGDGKIDGAEGNRDGAGRDAQRQDGRLRDASEQGDARRHGQVSKPGSGQARSIWARRPVATQSALSMSLQVKLRARARAGSRNRRSSWRRPRSCSIAGSPRNWGCRAPSPCRVASRSSAR